MFKFKLINGKELVVPETSIQNTRIYDLITINGSIPEIIDLNYDNPEIVEKYFSDRPLLENIECFDDGLELLRFAMYLGNDIVINNLVRFIVKRLKIQKDVKSSLLDNLPYDLEYLICNELDMHPYVYLSSKLGSDRTDPNRTFTLDMKTTMYMTPRNSNKKESLLSLFRGTKSERLMDNYMRLNDLGISIDKENDDVNDITDILEKNIDKWNNPQNCGSLSFHKHITPEFIKRHKNKPWNWNHLSSNTCITPDLVTCLINKNWDWHELSSNKSIVTLDFIKRHKDKPWDWEILSGNTCITPDLVEFFIDKSWNWSRLSYNKSIVTLDFIKRHKNKPWDWKILSNNTGITPNLVEFFIDEPWDWDMLSSNKSIATPDFVEKHIDKEWNWGEYGLSVMMPGCFIEKYPNEGWYWGENGLSSNPKISVEFVEKHAEQKWEFLFMRIAPKRFDTIKEFLEFKNKYVSII